MAESKGPINVAIIGVGNCACSLVEGRYFYKDANPEEKVPGLMHVALGGYHINDINFVAAFDINVTKVGKDLSEAIRAEPNNSFKMQVTVPRLGVTVERGMQHDGLGKYLKEVITPAPGTTADITAILKDTKTDVVLNYLPVGSEEATRWYAEKIIQAGCGMVNCIPVFLASNPGYWADQFTKAGLPIIGDDIKSQFGATLLHRIVIRNMDDRGYHPTTTRQLNIGGDQDFNNMREEERLVSKRISKTGSVQSQLEQRLAAGDIYVGPSGYVPYLEGRKVCYLTVEGTGFGNAPMKLDAQLEVWDSPNSAGVVIDAIRCIKLAMDRHIGGPLISPSSYFMKTPPVQYTDDKARQVTEDFIAGKLER